jgi:hypothetical protein
MTSALFVDHLIANLARQHHGLVPHGALLQSGVEPAVIRRRIELGLLKPAVRGVSVIGCDPPSAIQRSIAAALRVPNSAVSHRAAAALLGAPIDPSMIRADLAVIGDRSTQLAEVNSFRTLVPFELSDTQWMHGVRVTSPSRNVVQLAQVMAPGPLELILDHYLLERRTTLDRVGQQLQRFPRLRGRHRLESLLDDRQQGFGLVRSWFEQAAVRVLTKAGIAAPVRNFNIKVGGRTRVIDLAWPEWKVGVEADSWRYHSNPGDWGRTRVRDRSIQATGWRLIPCVPADTRRPAELIEAVKATLELARVQGILCG